MSYRIRSNCHELKIILLKGLVIDIYLYELNIMEFIVNMMQIDTYNIFEVLFI